ncbi:MAG: hypothetical protein MMC33_002113 [Icmadophila ericetorum]|nr:hypothetical protein [Icmadophila ericetorum]
MTAIKRRRGESLHIDLPKDGRDEKPSIAALFLIQFDARKGYTIVWRRSIPGLELAESVEYKSLPSGLHDVEEDLIYFMHGDDYIGISAFVNKSDTGAERNALMLAVGALVPLSQGRLGRSWVHVEKLKELVKGLLDDPSQTKPLENFWNENKHTEDKSTPTAEPRPGSGSSNGYRDSRRGSRSPAQPRSRKRATSGASALAPFGQKLSPYHPARSLPELLDTFGPLIYPLYKAALLRKRILMVTRAPVETYCNFVYNVSVLSNIPSLVSGLVPLEPLPTRLQPLFSIGVHDIDYLNQTIPNGQSGAPNGGINGTAHKDQAISDYSGYGWVACTTDDVLATKTKLYDVLVTIPPSYTKQAREKAWPKLQTSTKIEIRASQRDLRRYRTLRQGLRKTQSRSRAVSPYSESRHYEDNEEDQAPLLPIVNNTHETFDDASSTIDDKLIEPLSWPALAYSSFMWWASAGEKRADRDQEAENDASLLRNIDDYSADFTPLNARSRRRSSLNPKTPLSIAGDSSGALPELLPELAIIAYFHRLTTLILGTLAEIVQAWDNAPGGHDDDRQAETRSPPNDDESVDSDIVISAEDIARMGLDGLSEGDKRFVQELLELYWGRRGEVQGARIECCGVRIV